MKERIIEIIKNACALDEDVNVNSKLNELSLDSLSFISVIAELEAACGVTFEPEELNISAWETVGDLILATEGKTNA